MIASKPRIEHLYRHIWLLNTLMPLAQVPGASARNIRAREGFGRVLALEKVHNANGVGSGEAHNHSSNTMRNVQFFIRYSWLWDNEMKPGAADLGTSTYYILPKEIPPGGRLPFTFRPSPPLPNVAGGSFANVGCRRRAYRSRPLTK